MGVNRSADHTVSGLYLDRHGFPGNHASINRRLSLTDISIGGNPVTRPHHTHRTHGQLIDRHDLLKGNRTVGAWHLSQHTGFVGSCSQQCLERCSRIALRPGF